jgi:hypothetical protein
VIDDIGEGNDGHLRDAKRRGREVAERKMWKVVASAVCWTISVASALLAGAMFASGSVLCRGDDPQACTPQTWALLLGVILAVGFGAAGAALHKPRTPTPQGRFPWQYRD